MKKCTSCGILKLLSEFHKRPASRDGLDYWCKDCRHEYYLQRKKEIKINSSNYWDSPLGIYNRLKNRKYNKSIVEITKEEFVAWYNAQEKKCVYCDLPEEKLVDIDDSLINQSQKLSIDRIDNLKGYETGNLVLSCIRCNTIKSNFFTFKEMRDIAQKYIKPRWENVIYGLGGSDL